MKILQPVGPRCLIKPFQSAEKSSSGLILENNSNTATAPVRGTVIRAGETSAFKTGDELFFRRFSVDTLKTATPDGEVEVYIVDDEDVLMLEIES